MPSSDNFTDSTDWLSTPLSALAPLENALRCQVCKDFFTTPMITSCSHTFCSLCIRRYLSQEGRCPACREADQEIKLRRNWSLEEAVTQFQTKREELLNVARQVNGSQGDGGRPKKRRKVEHPSGNLPERRSTRSQSRRLAVGQDVHTQQSVPSSQEEIQDSDEGSVYEDTPRQTQDTEQHDGMVACPCCGKRMKEAFINAHLDRCMAGEASPSPPRQSNTPQAQASSIAYHQTKPLQNQERLPTINYSILNDNALRRKLKELGIPNHGSKELMRKRHVEWINLWNANCDSLKPVSKQQLLKDLDKWEKTLGRQIDRGGPSGVMVKDFDRESWQKSNKTGFDDLIKKAREKRNAMAAATTKAESNDEEVVSTSSPAEQQQQPQREEPRSIEAIFKSGFGYNEDVLINGDDRRGGDTGGLGMPRDEHMQTATSGEQHIAEGAESITIVGSRVNGTS